MTNFGGFDHNEQALVWVVTLLERRYARYDGLDLTWETLEGLVKHNGPLRGPRATRPLPAYVAEFDALCPLELECFSGLEAGAGRGHRDDIAYLGTRHRRRAAGRAVRSGGDRRGFTFIGGLLAEIAALHPGLERGRVVHELGAARHQRFVEGRHHGNRKRGCCSFRRQSAPMRCARRAAPLVSQSPAMAGTQRELKGFLFRRMYRHEKVMGVWKPRRAR